MGEKGCRHRKATLVETNQKECRNLYHTHKHSPRSGTGRGGQFIDGFHSLLSLSVIPRCFPEPLLPRFGWCGAHHLLELRRPF